MKSVIIYYSYAAGSRLTAEQIMLFLREMGEVDIFELKGGKEIREFMGTKDHYVQHEENGIQNINFDLSGYDLIFLGISVWVSGSTNVMSNYLDECSGLEGKRVILYIISGGIGDQECFDYVQLILAKKGVKSFKNFSVPRDITKDKAKLGKFIKESLRFYV